MAGELAGTRMVDGWNGQKHHLNGNGVQINPRVVLAREVGEVRAFTCQSGGQAATCVDPACVQQFGYTLDPRYRFPLLGQAAHPFMVNAADRHHQKQMTNTVSQYFSSCGG